MARALSTSICFDFMEEVFEIVDEEDRIIGTAKRSECHKNPKLLHRTAGVLVFNSDGDVLMARRSLKKDTNPGRWSISSWGHLNPGESYEHAALRELKEELGITENLKLLFKMIFRSWNESEMFCIFNAVNNGPFKPDPEEVSEIKFFSIGELKKELKSKPKKFTRGCHQVMGEYFNRLGK